MFESLRVAFASRDARREQAFVVKTSESLGFNFLRIDELRETLRKPAARDFFVLGSGSSIEDLPNSAFSTISLGVSVGINAWPIHSFVPDMYCYEPVPESDSDHYRTMELLSREDILRKRPSVLFLKPRSMNEVDQLLQIPVSLREHVLIYGRFSPFTRSVSNLPRELTAMLGVLRSRRLESVLPDSGASIIRMAAMGVLMGFERIVFVGVDLNHTEYFWQRNPRYLQEIGLQSWDSGQKSSVHETMSAKNRPFTVTTMINALAEVAHQMGSQLQVASKKSELASLLPLFRF